MAEIKLKELREIRRRAQELLRSVDTDIKPFLHQKDKETFRRKPESESIEGDVNVTSSCSCLMSLALSNSFCKFYDVEDATKANQKAKSILDRIIDAPWMSSGLTANNAFSTALVLRTYGFLKQEGLLKLADIKRKAWELNFGLKQEKISDFAIYLQTQSNETSKYLYSSLSDGSRSLLATALPSAAEEKEKHEKRLSRLITLDLRRLVQSGWIYTKERFPNISSPLVDDIGKRPTGYLLARTNKRLFDEQLKEYFTGSSEQNLEEIAVQMAKDPDNFAINQYSASATVLYWFVDGLERGQIHLDGKDWGRLCEWACNEFNHERSLVLAEHDAMMDPIALAMAACLCAKIRNLATRDDLGTGKGHREMLPSMAELEHSILELFRHQATSGIWPKYFPLFHYQDAGSNFCFTFEMLEAVLNEFGHSENKLLDHEDFINGIKASVLWCEENRLKCSEGKSTYSGWNSGGDLESLEKERPESWATAVVHMFLWELTSVLSQHIQKRVLQKYGARQPKMSAGQIQEAINNDAKWREQNFGSALSKLQDIELFIDRKHDSLIRVLKEELLDANFVKTELQVRREKASAPISALLFGPPGTSKTQITKAVAEDLGWPMLVINPSEFVKGSFENVYLQAEDIFTDLMDLSAVVVLFDEMDALTQKRSDGSSESGGNHLDTATQFLTTSMLPKLADLHDNGGVVFFMATNFQENFDPAIKRAGRFDLLLCMGPPKLCEKIEKLKLFLKLFLNPVPQNDSIEAAKLRLYAILAKSPPHRDMLELFTFGEFKSFLRLFGKTGSEVCEKLKTCNETNFLEQVDDYSKSIGLKFEDLKLLLKNPTDISPLSKIDKLLITDLDKIKGKEIGKYFYERRLSKRQF